MEFKFNQDQSAMVETARSFAKKTIAPEVEKFDKPGAEYPVELIAKASELGFATMTAPTDFDGLGSGTLSAGLVLEELAAACGGFATAMLGTISAVLAVQTSAKPDAAKKLLSDDPKNTGVNWRASLAGLPGVSFEADSNGAVSGRAGGVIGAGKASWYAMPVRDGADVVIYAFPKDTAGLKVEVPADQLGLRAAGIGKIWAKCARSTEGRLGPVDPNSLLALVAPLQGCVAIGSARAALDAAENYGRERYQGGTQIIRHDTVAHLILANRAKINAARANLWRVMAANDAMIDWNTGAFTGQPNVIDAVLARVFATDAALQAATDSVQCFGGYGYMHDFPVEKRMRDARSIGVIFGTAPELLTHIKFSLEEA